MYQPFIFSIIPIFRGAVVRPKCLLLIIEPAISMGSVDHQGLYLSKADITSISKLHSLRNKSIFFMRFITLLSILLLSVTGFAQNYYLFVGTYTNGKSKGIYVYKFNSNNGKISWVSTASTKNPSYLAISSNNKYIYAVNENGNDQMGAVSAFSFDKMTGTLHFLNKQESGGADPCYISLNKTGKWAVVANYSGGNLSAIPVRQNGFLDPPVQVIRHMGSSINAQRQERAHVHSVVFSPDQRYLLTADLGMDKEMIYRFNPSGKLPLTDAQDSFINTLPGSGPRHFVFHMKKPFAYLINELSGTVDAFHYDDGRLINFQDISTHPDDFKGVKGSADIHISPNCKYLYASNRGDANSIAIFSIDSSTGKLHVAGFQSCMGRTPRNFVIDPTGHFLLVANQDSSNIILFKINQQTGLLTPWGQPLEVPNPVCLKMLKIN
jgi:6-phosphogluconolactonase